MAKSKLVQANKKIEEAVVGGYRKIEQTVVGGYQSIENTVVGIALGLVTWLIWRKMEGKAPIKVSGKTIGTVLLGDRWSAAAGRRDVPEHGVRQDGPGNCGWYHRHRGAADADPADKGTQVNCGAAAGKGGRLLAAILEMH